jgi:energy-coupling factor transport system ATP-binding protein
VPKSHDPAPTAGVDATRPAGLRADGWGWRHAGRSGWAVRGLDLVIEPGERVLLLGASGAGKSTLIQAFAGVLGGADEGEEEGRLEVGALPPERTRGRVGLLLQDPDSQLALARVGDDVAFGCENLGVPRELIWPRVARALDAVGLDLPLEHPTSELSGGQKQRVALAGVIAMRPSVVLLDEPTANLDPAGVIEVRDAVADVVRASNATFVVIEHRVDIWLDVVDRVVVLAPGGGVLADGTPDEVLQDRGDELARDGVWVPRHDPLEGRPARRPRAVPAPGPEISGIAATDALAAAATEASTDARGELLLTARGLVVARVPGVPVAGGIDLDLCAGMATAITGANGAGKTTLALTLAGLLPIAGGTLVATTVLAEATGSASSEARLASAGSEASTRPAAGIRLRRSLRKGRGVLPGPQPITWRSRELLTRIGMVFQDPEHQFVTGSVRGELEVSLKALRLDEAEIRERVTDVSSRLRLDDLLGANPYTLSGGEKRRLSVASALVARPRILVLDEPTFGQDARTWAELVRLLAEQLDRGTAIVAVTHDRAFIDALADQEIVVGAGERATRQEARS